MTNKSETIRALRRKAASTTFQPESDAFFAKAQAMEDTQLRIVRLQEQLIRLARYTDTHTREWVA